MENGSYTLCLRLVGRTNLETDLYSSNPEVDFGVFVTGKLDISFRESCVAVGSLV
jgi:hypothetical protein